MSNKISVIEFKRKYGMSDSGTKYNSRKINADGKTFDSLSEYTRYNELMIRLRANEIRDFEFQKRFEIIPKHKDERAAHYTCDFFYFDTLLDKWIIEDRKSEKTKEIDSYILRRKLTKIKYPDYIFLES